MLIQTGVRINRDPTVNNVILSVQSMDGHLVSSLHGMFVDHLNVRYTDEDSEELLEIVTDSGAAVCGTVPTDLVSSPMCVIKENQRCTNDNRQATDTFGWLR